MLALVTGLGLAACAASPAQLAGMEFVSISVTDGGAPRALVANSRITLGFTDSGLSGNAGCNHFGFTYRIENGRLIVSDGGMTAMGCDEDLNAQDQFVFEFLGSMPSISLVGSDLTLQGASIAMTLRDREVVEPDAPLVGPTWTVEGTIDGDAVSSVPGGSTASLVFHDDGSIDVDTGCNRGSGTWSSTTGGIEVGPLMLTKMACLVASGSLESSVLGVLGADSIAADIDGTELTLAAGGRGLILRAR